MVLIFIRSGAPRFSPSVQQLLLCKLENGAVAVVAAGVHCVEEIALLVRDQIMLLRSDERRSVRRGLVATGARCYF